MHHADILALAGLRVDGRKAEEIRRMQFKIGAGDSTADGSCYCEIGLNKVLAMVYGPQEASRRSNSDQLNEKGSIICQVYNAPFSGTERKKRKQSDRRSMELENIVKDTFSSVVMLEQYHGSDIQIVVSILETDGSIECAVLNSASLALVHAGICMSDMVVACSVGDVKQRICVDLNMLEQNSGGSYLPIAVRGRFEDIVYMQMQSRISPALLEQLIIAAITACRSIHNIMSTAIKIHAQDKEVVSKI